MTRGELIRLCAALAVGAAIAFPLGMRLRPDPDPPRPALAPAGMRQVFSPRILTDPYFIEQQRKNALALERQCRETGTYCAEAAAIRRLVEHPNDARP